MSAARTASSSSPTWESRLPRADIIDRRQPARCRLAAAGQQQLAGAAEAERVGNALGKRQHAGQFGGIGIVEDDLPLPGDGHQRRPGTGCQRRDRGRTRRVDDRLAEDALGHDRRSFRPRGAGGHRQVHRRLLDLGLRAGVLQGPAGDPLPEGFDLVGGELVAVGRHVRLVLVRDQAKEVGAVRIAGRDRLAAGAALADRARSCPGPGRWWPCPGCGRRSSVRGRSAERVLRR